MKKLEKNIFLIGFMGAGKSTIAAELEHELGVPRAEMDAMIVEREGKLVALVFPDETLTKRMSPEEILQLMKANLEKLNHLIPSYSKVSNIEVQDKPFEKTPKRSIKRFLYK